MLDQAEKLREMASDKKPKIITVTSGKGGVGKSNFVVNLSIILQKFGNRVLIFDADVGMGNDDVLMGFLPKYNVFDIIFNNKSFEEVLIQGPYGVKLLPGGSGLNQIENMSEKQRAGFIQKLSNLTGFDYIIMDTGAGINRTVLAFISCCDELIFLTTPEPTSLTDSYSLLKVVNHFKIKSYADIVINKAFDEDEGNITFTKLCNAANNFLKMDVHHLGNISDDKKVVQSVRMQKPFVIAFPNCNATKDIEEIAKKISKVGQEDTGLGIQGLFKKLFKIFS